MILLVKQQNNSIIAGMKLLGSILYHIFVVLGCSLFISKIVSRLLGLKEKVGDSIGLLLVYFLSIVLVVSVCWYIYNRKAPASKAIPTETTELQPQINALRQALQKPAVVLRSTPVDTVPESHVSCLGRVTWQLPGEEWPVDADGNRLEPLATLFVPDLPGVPAALSQVALITIFAHEEAWAEDPEEKPQLGCVIRTYPTLEGLVPCDYASGIWKTCILTPEAVAHDMPFGRCSGGGDEMWDKIIELEEKHHIEYEENICDAAYETNRMEQIPAGSFSKPDLHATYETHKIGGYPTFIQDGSEPEGYPFVLQITWDSEAGLDIGDAGIYYFFYNAEKNDWLVTSDCY